MGEDQVEVHFLAFAIAPIPIVFIQTQIICGGILLWEVCEGTSLVGLGRDDGDPGVSVGWVEQASLPAGIAWHSITKHVYQNLVTLPTYSRYIIFH